jgi:hypothetical protein
VTGLLTGLELAERHGISGVRAVLRQSEAVQIEH